MSNTSTERVFIESKVSHFVGEEEMKKQKTRNRVLLLDFPSHKEVIIKYGNQSTKEDFMAPLASTDLEDIRSYLEIYTSSYTTEVDDREARRLERKLPRLGTALFQSVFKCDLSRHIVRDFLSKKQQQRTLTISTSNPKILSLPWELLCTQAGNFLAFESPPISIRRSIDFKPRSGQKPSCPEAEHRPPLRVLFVTSRPAEASFIDPRSDPQAVMDALDAKAGHLFEYEFLQPPTFDNLRCRLAQPDLPRIDILHFDGHGSFMKESNRGFVYFEDEMGHCLRVDGAMLGRALRTNPNTLVVLSACQSAAVGESDQVFGSVAVDLMTAGISTVIAMTYSVLVSTTRQFFGCFYRGLAQGDTLGRAFDRARRDLFRHSERGTIQRGKQRVPLKVHDWFLPAFYQNGSDRILIKKARGRPKRRRPVLGRIPQLHAAGFLGRTRELWEIERAFSMGIRRYTITGRSGQGKTYLAQEAARWIPRTGMFKCAVFVSFSSYVGNNPIDSVLYEIGEALDTTFSNLGQLTAQLESITTLIVIDNLESLPSERLESLLDAAITWSEAGETRVLATTRTPRLHHASYEVYGKHRYHALRGLSHDDGLRLFQSIAALSPRPEQPPPDRDLLVELFSSVHVHPQAVAILSWALKTQGIAEVTGLLSSSVNNPLTAAINVAFAQLLPEARKRLSQLAIFKGGAFEDILLEVTDLRQKREGMNFNIIERIEEVYRHGDISRLIPGFVLGRPDIRIVDSPAANRKSGFKSIDRKHKPDFAGMRRFFNDDAWREMRRFLVDSAVVTVHRYPDTVADYLEFHPGLDAILQQDFRAEEQSALEGRYRLAYFNLCSNLFYHDSARPGLTRMIARREMRNLLCAAHMAPDYDDNFAVYFAKTLDRYLDALALKEERDFLAQRVKDRAVPEILKGQKFVKMNQAREHIRNGRLEVAQAVCVEEIEGLATQPTKDRIEWLLMLGRCQLKRGQSADALLSFQDALDATEGIPEQVDDEYVADIHEAMGNCFSKLDRNQEAITSLREAAYLLQHNRRRRASVESEIADIQIKEGNCTDAVRGLISAVSDFKRIGDCSSIALTLHQLGFAYQQGGDYNQAERNFREAANCWSKAAEPLGEIGAWVELGRTKYLKGKVEEAEEWYSKAYRLAKQSGNQLLIANILDRLAELLSDRRDRLEDARSAAEEALAIKKSMGLPRQDLGGSYVWLMKIALTEGNKEAALKFYRLAKEAGIIPDKKAPAGWVLD